MANNSKKNGERERVVLKGRERERVVLKGREREGGRKIVQ